MWYLVPFWFGLSLLFSLSILSKLKNLWPELIKSKLSILFVILFSFGVCWSLGMFAQDLINSIDHAGNKANQRGELYLILEAIRKK